MFLVVYVTVEIHLLEFIFTYECFSYIYTNTCSMETFIKRGSSLYPSDPQNSSFYCSYRNSGYTHMINTLTTGHTPACGWRLEPEDNITANEQNVH